MESKMYSIGEMARDSGLTVSALRFYDGAGVLVPEWVDPASGYRWYGPGQRQEARLLTRLRRVSMPLADIRLVLAGWSSQDAALVGALLDAHLLRLKGSLDEARRELSAVRDLLALREHPLNSTPHTDSTDDDTTLQLTLPAPELAAALDTVRFAVSTDPELPMLGGVHLDVDADEQALRLVATDRYRLAVARLALPQPRLDSADAAAAGTASRQVIVPVALVDAMRALLTSTGEAVLTLDGDRVSLRADAGQASGVCLDHDFPDYRRLTRLPSGRRVDVDVAALREALTNGPTHSSPHGEGGADVAVSLLAITADGSLTVVGDDSEGRADAGTDGGAEAKAAATGTVGDRVGVNRAFLLDALAAAARDRLVLELGSPLTPLAIRRVAVEAVEGEDEHSFSLLMPVRLDSVEQ
ncbi:DNA polymerase III subunit beta family protein [Streptacidiphilus cavernicola]|uniref:MerR family transcriptional regulator n=1 Tax=Streptacidiphilus cavernicola TaxID=3342716 RepID=A0ABV6W0B9_9ACTN